MKNRKKIEDLISQIKDAEKAHDAALTRFNTQDNLARTLLGVRTTMDKPLMDAIEYYHSWDEQNETIDQCIKDRAAAKTSMANEDAKVGRLYTSLEAELKTASVPLIKAVQAKKEELEGIITEAMSPFFSPATIKTVIESHNRDYISLDHSERQLRSPQFGGVSQWNTICRINQKLNSGEK